MENSIPNSTTGIDNLTINQNYHEELSKFNNAKVYRNLENGSLHLIAVNREDENIIDGGFLNSPNLLTNSIIVGHNTIGHNTQTLIDGQYTVNFIENENYTMNEQPENQHDGNAEIQLQPTIFQMVNTKDGTQVMFPGQNTVGSGCRRGTSTNLKDMATLTPIAHNIHSDRNQSYQNIALPPLTPIRKLKAASTSSTRKIQQIGKGQMDSKIKMAAEESNTDGSNRHINSIVQPRPFFLPPSNPTKVIVKKKIAKKLKKKNPTEIDDDVVLISEENQNDNCSTKFACQLCNTTVYGQLEFFAHLKQHYEPSNNGNSNGSTAAQPIQILHHTLETVSNNEFASNSRMLYTGQQETSVSHIMETDLKVKLKGNVAAQNEVVDDEDEMDDAEFSDTDDMFEGIQNVVDKVQDVSDWYDEEEFQATMSFKPGILDDDDDDDDDEINVIEEKETSRDGVRIKIERPDDDTVDGVESLGELPTINESDEKDKEKKQLDKEYDSKSGDKPWAKCLKCDKRFKSKNAYQYHETTHTGVRPHQCEDCGKCFSTIGALRIHSRLHTGVRPYKCRFCDRPFRQWGDMKYHITSIHTNEKKYQCEFCGKGFARRYSLVVHRRIHTGERNYRCEFCDKTFRASSYLVNHRRIHTGEKPHECSVCAKKFRVRSDMKRHMNIHTRSNTKASRKSQVNSKAIQPAQESAPSPSEAPTILVQIKSEEIKKEKNGGSGAEPSNVMYSDQNIDILRIVLQTEKSVPDNESPIQSSSSFTVKQEDSVNL